MQNFQYTYYNLRTLIMYIYVFFVMLYNKLLNDDDMKTNNFILDEESEYLERRIFDFETIFDSDCNSNVDILFYNKELYDKYMNQMGKTGLEIEWSRRILLEYTPRGNLAMYYDPYKMGFSYYCDQKTISYNILNACAMKYVKIFHCLDFFMDEHVIETILNGSDFNIQWYKNKLIKLHYDNITTNNVNTKKYVTNGPFIKRKSNNESSSSSSSQEYKHKPEKNKNKFLHVGKLSNVSFLNIPPKTQKVPVVFKSTLLDMVEENSDVQNQRLSYKMYKQG